MALARIVTSNPEQVAALAEYLRTRGYTVEFAATGALRTSPADLEMDLEGCTAEEAMSRAVAAEAGTRRAVAYDITGRPVEFADDEADPPAKGGNTIAQAWTRLAPAWRETLESLRLSAGRLREWLDEGRETLERWRAQRLQARHQADAVAVERRREREAERLAREAEGARIAQEEALRRAQEERSRYEREEAVRLAEAERVRRQREEATRQAELAAREGARRQEERARQQQQAERERRILEQYRREAHAEAVREAFDIEQDRAQEQVAAAETLITRREDLGRPAPRFSPRDGDWNKAAAAAILLALAATLGYAAYESRRPAAPLSNRDLVNSQNVSQPVPFGGVTVPPPAAAAPQPVRSAVPQSDPVPAVRPVAQPAPRRRVRRPSRAEDDDMIAEDEVVIHRKGSSRTRAAASGTTSGPKRISDLEE